jgi:hypothetical protein
METAVSLEGPAQPSPSPGPHVRVPLKTYWALVREILSDSLGLDHCENALRWLDISEFRRLVIAPWLRYWLANSNHMSAYLL